jgi:hypothetical protein
MNRNNDVFQVLVTKGNAALATAGTNLEALAVGQIGAFDAITHLAVGAATNPMPRDIYFAVGLNRSGAGAGATLEDFRLSAGQSIARKAVTDYTFNPHGAGRPMVVEIPAMASTVPGKEYGIKIEQRNSQVGRILGFNQFSNTYIAVASEDPVVGANPNYVIAQLIDSINLNGNSGAIASAFAVTGTITVTAVATTAGNATVTIGSTVIQVPLLTTDTLSSTATKIAAAISATPGYIANTVGGAVVSIGSTKGVAETIAVANGTSVGVAATDTELTKAVVSDIPGFISANPSGRLVLTLTSVPTKVYPTNGVNLRFYKFHQTVLVVSLISGFTAAAITAQEPREEEGSGTNIRQKEYQAAAWNGAGPYRVSETTGTAIDKVEFFADGAGVYDQFTLQYDVLGEAGWGRYEHPCSTIIAVPGADTVTRNSVAAFIDAVIGAYGFEALADDASASNVGPTVVEGDISAVTGDGVA